MVFLYVLIGVLVLIALLHFTAKSQYVVKRDINVQKPADKIFEYLKYLKNQDQWSPWNRKDPDMNKSYEGVDGTVGFISKWDGNKEVGSGEQEITGIIPGKRIESQLRFIKPMKSTSDAWLAVSTPNPGITNVAWGFSGKYNFPFTIVSHFMSMDKMVGKDFEAGLKNLKEILEDN